jgi:hypothetical protein
MGLSARVAAIRARVAAISARVTAILERVILQRASWRARRR